jgi:hypothetical protein
LPLTNPKVAPTSRQRPSTPAWRNPRSSPLASTTIAILNEKGIRLNLSGNEVYYAACSLPVVLKNSCSELHCQKVFNLISCSREMFVGGVRPRRRSCVLLLSYQLHHPVSLRGLVLCLGVVKRAAHQLERESSFIDNLLVRIHLIIVMISVDRPCAMGV